MKGMNIILIAVAIIAASFTTHAQKAIDHEIARIEKEGKASIVYQEKRNVATKKVYKVNYVITLNDARDIRRLEQAFEKERPNTFEASRTSSITKYKFADKKFYGEYTLTHDGRDRATLIVTKKYSANFPKNTEVRDDNNLDPLYFWLESWAG